MRFEGNSSWREAISSDLGIWKFGGGGRERFGGNFWAFGAVLENSKEIRSRERGRGGRGRGNYFERANVNMKQGGWCVAQAGCVWGFGRGAAAAAPRSSGRGFCIAIFFSFLSRCWAGSFFFFFCFPRNFGSFGFLNVGGEILPKNTKTAVITRKCLDG